MMLCKVRGKCVSTVKCENMQGISLVTVERIELEQGRQGCIFVAADPLGCPAGAIVLVSAGGAARLALSVTGAPVDHAVTAIVDNTDYLGLPDTKKN